MEMLTDFPERLKPGTRLFVGDSRQPMQISGSRGHSSGLLITLEGVIRPNRRLSCATPWCMCARGHSTAARRRILSPPADWAAGDQRYRRELGKVSSILETGANDVLIVHRLNNTELLLPNIVDVVLDIDLDEARCASIYCQVFYLIDYLIHVSRTRSAAAADTSSPGPIVVEKEKKYWVGFNLVKGIGSSRMRATAGSIRGC